MKAVITSILSLVLLLGAATAGAQAPAAAAGSEQQTPPSEVSVRQLMQVMQAHKLVDRMNAQMDKIVTATLSKMLEGRSLTTEQQQKIDAAHARMVDMLKEAMNWDSLEPMFLEAYTKSFSQSEIDSMLAFYSSPSGQAVVAKLPLVMENTSALMQQRMLSVMPKIQQVARDTAAQIKGQPDSGPKSSS